MRIQSSFFALLCLMLAHLFTLAGDCGSSTALVLNAGNITGTVTSGSNFTTYHANGCSTPDPTCGCNKEEIWYHFTTTTPGQYVITAKGNGSSNSGFDMIAFRKLMCITGD